MGFDDLLRKARLRVALFLVETGAKLADVEPTPEPHEATEPVPMPPVTVANTLSPAAQKMVEEGRAVPKRTKKEPPKPLAGSAADLIQRRRAAGG